MKQKRTLIIGISLLFLAMGASTSFAQGLDGAYKTPKRIHKERQEKEAIAQQEIAQRKKQQALRAQQAQAFADSVNDWYNRRDMRVTIEQMDENLDKLEADKNQYQPTREGKYTQRLRRFHHSDRVVLNGVGQVYVLDNMSYDPWSDSYYGYDSYSRANISINYGFPYSRYGWGATYGFGAYYPWYDYSPWYTYPRYYGWYGPRYYPGAWDYGWYGPRYYGWYDGYWDSSYYDPYYYGGYPVAVHHHYYNSNTPRLSRGVSLGNRTSRESEYGRALGRSIQRMQSSGNSTSSSPYYSNRSIRSNSNGGYRSNSSMSGGFGSSSGGYSQGSSSSSHSSGSWGGANSGSSSSRRR